VVDYVKVEVYGCNYDNWTKNQFLEFEGNYWLNTGLIEGEIVAQYNNLTFTIYESGKMCFKGSLHKYYNRLQKVKAPSQHTKKEIEKGFNGNTFNYTQLCYVLKDLNNKFNINLGQSILRNIEFGLNIAHQFNTEKILDNLMFHKGKLFCNPKSTNYKELLHTQYRIKCYNKSLQYGIKNNLMRYEIHFKKMKQVNDIDIVYLSDLKNRSLLNKVKNVLLIYWKEILFYDYTINESLLTHKEQVLILQFKNPLYWKGIKSNHLDRPKKKYYGIEAKHSMQLKNKISELIKNQWEQLNTNCVTFDQHFKPKNNNCVTNDHSSIGLILTQQQTKSYNHLSC